jgi:hypothetical protein
MGCALATRPLGGRKYLILLNMSRQRKYQRKKKTQGLCSICGKNPLYSSEMCECCFQNNSLAKGIINIGRNIKIKEKEKEILQRIRKQLSNKQKRTTSKYMSLKNILSKIASYYGISIGTARKIYIRNQISDGKNLPKE